MRLTLSSAYTLLLNMMLESLVPTWLVPTCTNMKELRIYNLSPVPNDPFRSPPSIRPVCPSLERLVTYHGRSEPDFSSLTPQLLRTLPNLHSIKLGFDWESDLDTWRQRGHGLLEALAPIGPQLLDLCITARMLSLLPPELPTWFPNLHTLCLPRLVALDADMRLFLNMESLRDLTVHALWLKEDYKHAHCPLTRLTLKIKTPLCLEMLPLRLKVCMVPWEKS